VNDSKETTHRGLRVPLARVWFDAREPAGAAEVVKSGWIIFGPKVEEFERRFAARVGAKHGIAVNSGSSALLVAMAALGVGPGDEIVAPDMTFVSTASSAIFLGAVPRFCDIERRYYGMDPAALEKCITPKTKAIVPVHYAGQSCELGPIVDIAKRRGVPVLEDAAESHLATWGDRCTGTIGEIGIFSFTPSKPMTTGEGGMIVTNRDDLADRCRKFRNFGDHGKFDWRDLGFNFRMPEVMGAVGLAQLDKLDEAVKRRREVAARYRKLLANCELFTLPEERRPQDHNYQLFTLLLSIERLSITRDQVVDQLWELGISTRAYYPALHRAGVFAPYGPYRDEDFPNALWYCERCISLPVYPNLTVEEQDSVVAALLRIVEGHRRA
jgi:dTDP-4-amino-4,6-dideoxygalactose transaminase